MHIPDGFLSPPVWATLDVVALPAVGWAARRAQRDPDSSRIPLLGVMGAFVFAAQMINFPVGIGTSGHLVGGALLAVILGPSAAAIVLTAVIALQALIFQDGGILALGANVVNMAIAGVAAAYLPYRWLGHQWRTPAIFAAGVLSVMSSACLALSELLVSGVRIPQRMLWASLAFFAANALIEGAITVAAVRAIERLNPGWVRTPAGSGSRIAGVVAIAAIILVMGGVLIASAAPDGIERLAAALGVAGPASAWHHAPLADYELRGIQSLWMRKALAGLAGLVLIYAACALFGRFLERQRSA